MALTQVQGQMILPSTTLTTPIVATTMGVGGATPAASGSGITFPATQSASTDANTLDDYEEGTWTPVDGSGAGLSFSVSSATYVKIGKLVFVNAYLTYPSTGEGTVANIAGLPFTSQSIGYSYVMGRCQANYVMAWQVNQNTTAMNGNTANSGSVTNANLSSTYNLISGCYIAAA